MLQKSLKKIIAGIIAMAIIASLVFSSGRLVVRANSLNVVQNQTVSELSEINGFSGSVLSKYDSSDFDVRQINVEELIEYAQKIGIDTNADEIIISDSQLIALLQHEGAEIEPINSRQRAHGVTKIVTRDNGSWDIYLSASFIRDYYFWAAAAAGLLAVIVPGIGKGLLVTAMGVVASYVERNTKHGVVVVIRGWRITTLYHQ